jgi:hypothetical protein
MNCEREGAVCEVIVIMQILPGSSDNAGAYKCIRHDLQRSAGARRQPGARLNHFCNAPGTLGRKSNLSFV